MELPIQLAFFKKLELYQVLLAEDKKAKNGSETVRDVWRISKSVLKYAHEEHHHRMSPLGPAQVVNVAGKLGIKQESISAEKEHALRNLVNFGFANFADLNKEPDINAGVVITREGFLMGSVISDLDGGNKWKYKCLYVFAWITAISGALLVVINFAKTIIPLMIDVIFAIVKLF